MTSRRSSFSTKNNSNLLLLGLTSHFLQLDRRLIFCSDHDEIQINCLADKIYGCAIIVQVLVCIDRNIEQIFGSRIKVCPLNCSFYF